MRSLSREQGVQAGDLFSGLRLDRFRAGERGLKAGRIRRVFGLLCMGEAGGLQRGSGGDGLGGEVFFCDIAQLGLLCLGALQPVAERGKLRLFARGIGLGIG